MRQRSIDIDTIRHRAPIPQACRIGPLLATSAISGRDAANGDLPDDVATQAHHAFANLDAVLGLAGLDRGDVLKLTVLLADDADRAVVNEHWTRWYPDPDRRPARHTMVVALREGMRIQLEALAVAKDAAEAAGG